MLNFHWMHRSQESTVDFLKSFSNTLEESGYKSILYVYDPLNSDYFIKIARAMTLGQKLKHMFAIRTYSISPEFLSMICKSFDEIETNRIMLNIVSGDKYQMVNEQHVNGVIGTDISTSDSRIQHTKNFMDKFVNLDLIKSLRTKMELVLSGSSDTTLQLAKQYADYNLTMTYEYEKDPSRYLNDKVMLASSIIVVETIVEKIFYEELLEKNNCSGSTIIGNRDEVINKFIELESSGVTDILLALHSFDRTPERIHQLVSDINKGII